MKSSLKTGHNLWKAQRVLIGGKIRRLRQYLGGWNIQVEGKYRKLKKSLLQAIDQLNKKL